MRRGERGFTYLGVLVLVALIGLFLSAAGEVTSVAAQRERETQLLWAGQQYRVAIARYFRQRHAYPRALSDLLGDAPDSPLPARYLRRLYPDPMTNAVDWELIAAPGGGVMGVRSRSKRAPLKKTFVDADREFADAASYNDWQFAFVAGRRRPR